LLDDDGELRNWRSTFTVNWLHHAAGYSALSVVRYLYELGLDAKENHPEFGNALWNAAQCGREDVLEQGRRDIADALVAATAATRA